MFREEIIALSKWFKKTIKIINDHLSLLVVLPAFLGAVWQLVNLNTMGLSYIRFFSVSQMLPDGILITYILLLLFLTWRIVVFFIFWSPNKDENKNESNDGSNQNSENIIESLKNASLKVKLFKGFICTVLAIIIGYASYNIYTELLTNQDISIVDLIFLPGLLLMMLITLGLMYFVIGLIVKFNDFLKKIVSITFTIIVLYFLNCSKEVLIKFNDSLISPKYLENIDNILCNLQQRNERNVRYKTKYFNDTYIFIEKAKYSDILKQYYYTSYEIIKIDEMFDIEDCVGYSYKKFENELIQREIDSIYEVQNKVNKSK